ncbi:MAG: endonuclease/exonuclease/phosphatase family protein, partial [Gemmatimonadaceae bacterium]
MNRLVVLMGVALASCMSGGGAPAPVTGGLNVLVYNIHAGKDAKGADSLDGLAKLVLATNADIVLLQEVDNGTRRSGNVNQPAVLAAKTGFHAAFGSALDYDGGKYGVAILSRWPILKDSLFHLPVDPPQERSGGSHEPRGALRVVVASPYGRLAVINTHLDATGTDRWRKQEADSITSLVTQTQREEPMVIVGGDFNSTPESAVQVKLRGSGLRDSWMECGGGQGFSFPDDNPVKRIDYLFLTGGFKCVSARVINSRVSDHRPVQFMIAPPPAVSGTAPSVRQESANARAVPQGPANNLDPRTPLTKAQRDWVENTLASLTLRERAGQMVHVWALGDYTNAHDS